jgi:hypothetical protein
MRLSSAPLAASWSNVHAQAWWRAKLPDLAHALAGE